MIPEAHDDVVAAWDAVSAAYQERYEIPATELHLGPMVPAPAVLGFDVPVVGRTVVDFGCGGGQNAVACALAGARAVVGVDPSEAQLGHARALAERHGATVDFVRLGADVTAVLPDEVDLVISVYALQYVADLDQVLRGLAAHMVPGATLVIGVDHPIRLAGDWVDDTFVVDGYFDRGWQSWSYDFPEADTRVTMRRFRRTTEEWVTALLRESFVLRGLYEPRPPATPDTFGRRSKFGTDDRRNVFHRERLERVPGSLVLVAERGSCPR